jgi:uncharacterized surface protein with fasciclin (FAS1) repeats
LVPLETTSTEVEEQAEQKIEATPVSAIVVQAPRDAVAGTDRAATRAEQMGVAMVVESDIGADNGVIHGIHLLLLPPEVLRWF